MRGHKVIVDRTVTGIGSLERFVLRVNHERKVVGNGNELRIKRLLQMFKIFNGISEKQLVFDTVLGQILRIGIIIARIKEILVAKVFINVVAIPKRARISVKYSGGIAALLVQDGWCRFKGVVRSQGREQRSLRQPECARFKHRFRIRSFSLTDLVEEI